ncbi:Transcription-repair coupling factor [Fructilactobacillus florum 2F]|nr:transcription-repair coupling factor [Fructilactobacillus florum]EKK20101.1 Transcription-repair coupling factor [Fructilactobacillus florum 2F]
MKLTKPFLQTNQVQNVLKMLQPHQRQLVTGTSGVAQKLFLTALVAKQQQPLVFLTDTEEHAEQACQEFQTMLPKDQLFSFPAAEGLGAQLATDSGIYQAARVEALHALQLGKPVVVVASLAGLKHALAQPTRFQKSQLQLAPGQQFELGKLQQQLVQMGYRRTKLVDTPGQFAVRGSIVDIYPLTAKLPVRLDFFDDELDSLRSFEPGTQRSQQNLTQGTVLPVTDFLLTATDLEAGKQALRAAVPKMTDSPQRRELQQLLKLPVAETNNQQWSNYRNLFWKRPASLLNYLAPKGIVALDDYVRIRETERQGQQDQAMSDMLAGQSKVGTLQKLLETDQHPQLLLSLFQRGLGRMTLTAVTDLQIRPMQRFFGQLPRLKTELEHYRNQGRTVIIMVANEERRRQVAQTLADFKIKVAATTATNIQPGVVQLTSGKLTAGFEFAAGNLVVITEAEMFQRVSERPRPIRTRQPTFTNAERIKNYTDLKPGDYVVHVNHGIGRYEGLQTMEVDGKHQDYLALSFKNNAHIYIPVTQLNLIQKYVGSEEKAPRLNKLGGNEWAKTKSQVSQKVDDMADELVDLYAKREQTAGFAFPADDDYQREFEAAFAYAPTPDQVRSVQEIKHDMEQPHPMDRLLVGDVGYGKTEVAMRAAFKAVCAGKQVAMLVPTTVLAQQHYETFQNRFSDFPVTIGGLSRFNSAKETRTILQKLNDGHIDIIIGTHRLLSKDLHYHDLGLLIVDEEQRFGVKHKEKIKELKKNVDVLTLTATPIPRTLNMSMMGVRDLSVIETPPANRYPIQTFVLEQNDATIVDASRREMQRNGQIFYLHNRVKDIDQTVMKLQRLLPDARIGLIHGKLTENQLEQILFDFINGAYDILVTTTIIETGVDMPNVNTLFVENADRMGLSQLYQLRGRIGRSNRIGQAYFMYQPDKVLTEAGENRLEAIKDFTELGSGFKVAMRDLSIRGAGNVLGRAQHGFIASVGYDMYTKMLSDAVASKQGKPAPLAKTDAELDLGIEAYLPSSYISDQQQKIEMYKRLRQIENDSQFNELRDDLVDRFGEYPQPVANLLMVDKLKMRADYAQVEQIKKRADHLEVVLSPAVTTQYSSKEILHAIAATKFRSIIKQNHDKYQIELVIQPTMASAEWLLELDHFLQALEVSRDKQRQQESAKENLHAN